jgi:phosphoglycolate phosphatase-like HAD superfamily hydrolase
MDYQAILRDLKPVNKFFIGIDSDGCVFDTMEVKQKEFFIPNALKYFELTDISEIVKETWEFVNLYSIYRGGNRFTSLLKVFELLAERKEIIETGYQLPDLSSLREWVKSESKLSNATLQKYFHSNYDTDLEKVVNWTEAINKDIRKNLRKIHPFVYARKAITKISETADLMIVSQTPLEALDKEWEENDLRKYAVTIAGQEHGTKTEHIALAAKGKYDNDNILMIGDAKGDMDAAFNNEILFYPVIPGKEEESWERFYKESFDKFLKGTYSGHYENSLLEAFNKSLPETPPWKNI